MPTKRSKSAPPGDTLDLEAKSVRALNDASIGKEAKQALKAAVKRLQSTRIPEKRELLRVGVDLGTASIIVMVIGADGMPLATELQTAQVARDGLVVDYIGAVDITRRLVGKLEQRLGLKLTTAAIAMPPGVNPAECSAHRHVVEASGLQVSAVLDEPTAAGTVLGISDGVVVDIGGGTTGLSVFQDGKVVYVADEATGGTHVALVLMGRYGIDFDKAEAMKLKPSKAEDVRVAVLPVMEKMASIVKRHISGHEVNKIWLVGGTSALKGIEKVFADTLGIETVKPPHPMMVTPLGIAMNSTPAPQEVS
ncbi:MAG: ethanolamine utilization protein EutJ [Propionibacteriaceae bacterium]|jgi:ethanolamine utilization protein EutJ|nr:ethanolamine utilization protein EutJ [Propionibacteriaceae bacterium]